MSHNKHNQDTEMEESNKELHKNSHTPQDNSSQKESVEEKVNELNDKYLRLYSDFENFRKRTNKERADLIQSANQSLLLHILPVYDDFERAIGTMEQVKNPESIKEGMLLIFSKLQKVLQQAGVEEIKTIGEEFDPELHEAIAKIPSPEPSMKGKVIDQAQKGFKLNDKIIRHAKVVVGE